MATTTAADDLTAVDAVKQEARRAMVVAVDKARLASLALSRPDTMELDVAIIKATSAAFHVVPKEKHVRTLKAAVSARSPRGTVAYVNAELRARLATATDWVTALKTLMVFHRLMRESDASYLDDLLRLGGGGGGNGAGAGGGPNGSRPTPPRRTGAAATATPRFGLDGWVDTVNIAGRFEGSAFARALARYLDETLDVYEGINFYLGGADGGAAGAGAAAARLRSLAGPDLLFQLPRLQRLLLRLADCVPTGPAAADPIVQAACLAVAQESFRAYRAASEGLINLADRFFDMDAADAARGADAYRQATAVTARLQAFYRAAEGMPGLRQALQFPRLEPPPPDFLAQMEAYIREGGAPSPLGDGPGGSGAGGDAPSTTATLPTPAPVAVAPLRPGAAGMPLRRGTRAPPPAASSGARSGGLVVAAPPSPSTPAAAIIPRLPHGPPPAAPLGPAPVDAILDLLGGEEVAATAAAPPPAAVDPFADPFASVPQPALVVGAGGAGGGLAAAPPPAPGPAAPMPLMGANPFGDATALAPPVVPSPQPAAPPPTAAPAWGNGSTAAVAGGASTTSTAASPSPPRPGGGGMPSAAEPADPFAGLLGGLSLGPSPATAPPLRKAAPPAGAPMSADRVARFAAAAGTLPVSPSQAGSVSPQAAAAAVTSGTSPWG